MDRDIIKRFRDKVNEHDLVLQMYRNYKGKNCWNIICSAMDWIDVVVEAIDTKNLSNKNDNNSSIKVMTFITCIGVMWEAVQQLQRVFFDTNAIPFAKNAEIFQHKLFDASDNDYFQTIRACFAAHQINLNDYFTGGKQKERRYASWSGGGFGNGDFSVILYSNQPDEEALFLDIYFDELIRFAEQRYRYLNTIAEEIERQVNQYLDSWKNKKIQQMAIEIARRIQSINESGYLYLDFHLSRLFFSQDGRLYLNFSNLIFPDRNKQQWAEEDFFDMEACSYPVEFAEPAIVQGKQKYFDYSSQNYSMAAMFFYLMFGRYAYEGRLMDGYVDDSERAHYEKFRDYHKMPVFIFEPEDDSNALGLFADEQRIVELWKDAAPALRDLFLRAMCQKTAVRT